MPNQKQKNQLTKFVNLLQQQNAIVDQLVSDISILKKDIEDLKKVNKEVKFNDNVEEIKEEVAEWWWNGILF